MRGIIASFLALASCNLIPKETFFTIQVGNGPGTISVADFNSDGELDFAISTDQAVKLCLGLGGATFDTPKEIPTELPPGAISFGDFNNDEELDLVVVSTPPEDAAGVALGDGNGAFSSQPFLRSVGAGPKAVAVGDFNGDSNLDFVVANVLGNTAHIALGDGTGSFTLRAPIPTGQNGNVPLGRATVAVGDFNNDGNLDITTATLDEAIQVLLGDGSGDFTLQPPITGIRANAVIVEDIDQDNNADILVAEFNVNIRILVGAGDGTFSQREPVAVGDTPGAIVVADFDNNGVLDFVAANTGESTVRPALGNGDGTFVAEPNPIKVGAAPVSIVAGDFDQDGTLDLLTANSADKSVSVLLGLSRPPR